MIAVNNVDKINKNYSSAETYCFLGIKWLHWCTFSLQTPHVFEQWRCFLSVGLSFFVLHQKINWLCLTITAKHNNSRRQWEFYCLFCFHTFGPRKTSWSPDSFVWASLKVINQTPAPAKETNRVHMKTWGSWLFQTSIHCNSLHPAHDKLRSWHRYDQGLTVLGRRHSEQYTFHLMGCIRQNKCLKWCFRSNDYQAIK